MPLEAVSIVIGVVGLIELLGRQYARATPARCTVKFVKQDVRT